MKFNLEDLNPATTFQLDESNPDAGAIRLRIATAGLIDELRRKFVKTKPEYRSGQRYERTDVDHNGYDSGLWDYCIVGWDGVEDEKGKPIPCTAENKMLLMRESPDFADIVRNCMDVLQEEKARRTEAAAKN